MMMMMTMKLLEIPPFDKLTEGRLHHFVAN